MPFIQRAYGGRAGILLRPFELTWQLLLQLVAALARYGTANILYSDGTYIFAQADGRRQISGRFESPGLALLERQCTTELILDDYSGVSIAGDVQMVVLLASVPLTAIGCHFLARGTVIVLAEGRVLREEIVTSNRGDHSLNI